MLCVLDEYVANDIIILCYHKLQRRSVDKISLYAANDYNANVLFQCCTINTTINVLRTN